MSNIKRNIVLRLRSEDTWLQLLTLAQFCIILANEFLHILFSITFSYLEICSAVLVAYSYPESLIFLSKENSAFSWHSYFKSQFDQNFNYVDNLLRFPWLKSFLTSVTAQLEARLIGTWVFSWASPVILPLSDHILNLPLRSLSTSRAPQCSENRAGMLQNFGELD